MDSNLYLKERKGLAFGYSIYALLCIGMTGILLNSVFSSTDWHAIDKLLEALIMMKSTLLFLLFAMGANILLAIGSWKLLSLSIWIKKLLLIAAILIPSVLIVRNIPSLWYWYQGSLPEEIGKNQIISSSLLTVGYVIFAYQLSKTCFKIENIS